MFPYSPTTAPLSIISMVAGHFGSGGNVTVENVQTRVYWVVLDVDFTAYEGTGNHLQWLGPDGTVILDWRPSGSGSESLHWHGLQGLAPGDSWTFTDPSSLGMDVTAWGLIIPSASGT